MSDDGKKDGAFPRNAQFDRAVALQRDADGRNIPKVTASGKGKAAEELIRLALQYNIPIKYDPDLVQVLSRLGEGDEIPEEAYLVVAEVLAFIYMVNQQFGAKPA